jgi:hypothetical protein
MLILKIERKNWYMSMRHVEKWSGFILDSIRFWCLCITHRIAGVWTLSIVRILIVTRKKNKNNVSDTGSVSVFRWGETPILLGPLERANLSLWTTSSGTVSYINTWDQVESMRANKKKCNKNLSKALTCVELG